MLRNDWFNGLTPPLCGLLNPAPCIKKEHMDLGMAWTFNHSIHVAEACGGQPGMHSAFQASLGCRVRPWLKTKQDSMEEECPWHPDQPTTSPAPPSTLKYHFSGPEQWLTRLYGGKRWSPDSWGFSPQSLLYLLCTRRQAPLNTLLIFSLFMFHGIDWKKKKKSQVLHTCVVESRG